MTPAKLACEQHRRRGGSGGRNRLSPGQDAAAIGVMAASVAKTADHVLVKEDIQKMRANRLGIEDPRSPHPPVLLEVQSDRAPTLSHTSLGVCRRDLSTKLETSAITWPSQQNEEGLESESEHPRGGALSRTGRKDAAASRRP